MHNNSFEVVESSGAAKIIKIILVVVGVAALGIGLSQHFGGSGEKATQTASVAPAPPIEARPEVRPVAKDPAKQTAFDQQLEKLLYFIANPTGDDAVITVEWLAKKYGQPPDVVIRDLFVLIGRLKVLSDPELAAFFNSEQNPWRDDQGYNAIIKFVGYRDYLEFIRKCAALYQERNPPVGWGAAGP